MNRLGNRQWELKGNRRSRLGPTRDGTTPLDRTHAALNIVQTIAAYNCLRVKAATIVAYTKRQNIACLSDVDLNF